MDIHYKDYPVKVHFEIGFPNIHALQMQANEIALTAANYYFGEHSGRGLTRTSAVLAYCIIYSFRPNDSAIG